MFIGFINCVVNRIENYYFVKIIDLIPNLLLFFVNSSIFNVYWICKFILNNNTLLYCLSFSQYITCVISKIMHMSFFLVWLYNYVLLFYYFNILLINYLYFYFYIISDNQYFLLHLNILYLSIFLHILFVFMCVFYVFHIVYFKYKITICNYFSTKIFYIISFLLFLIYFYFLSSYIFRFYFFYILWCVFSVL